MRVLFSGYTARTTDNFRPLLEELEARGHEVAGLCFPHPVPAANRELLEWPFRELGGRAVAAGGADLSRAELRERLASALAEFNPDVVLLDDILNYPSNAFHEVIRTLGCRTPVFAFQHGFFQWWHIYRRAFPCDRLLVYGPRDARQLGPEFADRVEAFGLPKLSRLARVPHSDDGSVLFLAQDTPRAEVVALALREYRTLSGRTVRIRPHPQHPHAYDALLREDFPLAPSSEDVVAQVAACYAVIVTGSTAGMEALVLGKPVVSLPSYSASIFAGSPAEALDYTGQEILRVLESWDQRTVERDEFLADAIATQSFDLGQSAARFEALVARHRTEESGVGRPPLSTLAAAAPTHERSTSDYSPHAAVAPTVERSTLLKWTDAARQVLSAPGSGVRAALGRLQSRSFAPRPRRR